MPSTPSPSGWTHSVIPWKMKMQVCGYFFFFFRSEWIALDKENEATHHFYKEKKSSPDQHPKNTMAFFFFFLSFCGWPMTPFHLTLLILCHRAFCSEFLEKEKENSSKVMDLLWVVQNIWRLSFLSIKSKVLGIQSGYLLFTNVVWWHCLWKFNCIISHCGPCLHNLV